MPSYEICIDVSRIHPVDAWLLNHHVWKLSPPAIKTEIMKPIDRTVPIMEIVVNAKAQTGIDNNITVIVAGG